MLIPRFTIRSLLVLTAFAGAFSLAIASAMRGEKWAIASTAAVGALGLVFLFHAATFLFAYVMSEAAAVFRKPKTSSPFAGARLPPQLVRPEEPE